MNLLFPGALDLPSWGDVVAAQVLSHIAVVAVAIFLHRHRAHHALHSA
jgi:stearoyl-CoA desaturase (Delta-9 desaturase)